MILSRIAKCTCTQTALCGILPAMHTILRFLRNDGAASRSLKDETDLYDRYGLSIKVADAGVGSAKEVAELIEFWQPDGCIVNNDKLPEELFANLPTVFHHRDIKPGNPRHATVRLDEKAIAAAAARHLLSLELASYAYVPPTVDESWSRLRERHFVHILGLNGHGVACYDHPKGRMSEPKRLSHLASWIADLPRPVGVFAANDATGAIVSAACDHRKLSIPGDVALLGVDNDESICEVLRPTLSSIAVDVPSARCETFRLISLLVAKRRLKNRNSTIAPIGVVRRASTFRAGRNDPAVAAACELIRRQACNGLKARDVAATFPCGRRMAEIRFRAMLGHSILDEILAARRARALAVTTGLRTPSCNEIAALCGYRSRSSAHRLLADPSRSSRAISQTSWRGRSPGRFL